MKRITLPIVIICAFALIVISISCTITPFTSTLNKSASEVITGNYYLDGDLDHEYIQIISDSKMSFVGFDIDYLANYLVKEGTGLTGKDAEEFMIRHNLPYVFSEEIVFELDLSSLEICVKALSDTSEDFWVPNFRMQYDNHAIMFMGDEYLLDNIED